MNFNVVVSDEAKENISSQSSSLTREELTASDVSKSLEAILKNDQVLKAVEKLAAEYAFGLIFSPKMAVMKARFSSDYGTDAVRA